MSAGIPAINHALLWHALQHFGAKTVFYQVVEPPPDVLCRGEESAEVKLFPVTGFLAELVVQSLADFLDRRDYAAARTMLRRFIGCFPKRSRKILDLLRAVEFHLALDFKSSEEFAARAAEQTELQGLANRFSLQGLGEIDQDLRRLTSLLELITAQLRDERYIDALWRLMYLYDYVEGLLDEIEPELTEGERKTLEELRADCFKLDGLRKLRNAKLHPKDYNQRLRPERNQGISGSDFDSCLSDENLRPARKHLAPFLRALLERLAMLAGARSFEQDYQSLNREILKFLRE